MSGGDQIQSTPSSILDAIISDTPPSYALIRRNLANGGADFTDILVGDAVALDHLADLVSIPLTQSEVRPEHGVLLLLPFRQIRERGYECIDDGEPLWALSINKSAQISSDELAHKLPQKISSLTTKDIASLMRDMRR